MGNDYLRLASTFHGLHTISAEVAPLISAGIDMLDADTFRLQCLHTLTGIMPNIPPSEGVRGVGGGVT